jgi:hypothetical protein
MYIRHPFSWNRSYVFDMEIDIPNGFLYMVGSHGSHNCVCI